MAKYLEENADEAEEEAMINIPPLPEDPAERQAILRDLAARPGCGVRSAAATAL